MTDNEKHTPTAGSARVLHRGTGEVFGKPRLREVRRTAGLRSAGSAGPSPEVSQCDHRLSGADGAGRENEERS